MSIKEGDGREGQPAEGVSSLDDLVGLMDDGGEEGAQDESEDGEEDADESEAEGESGDGEEEGEEGGEEPTVVLKHDGKEITLKQSEALELAQKGFDYTQKTMAVAEQRKAVEAERQQAEQHRKQLEAAAERGLHNLQALEKVLAASIGAPPDVALASQDVALYIAQKEQYEARKGQLAETQQAISRMQEEQARQRQTWIAQKSAETEKALKDTLPGWTDNTLNELIDYAGKHGIGQANFDHVLLEKGFWELANKARAYDALVEKKAQLKPVNKLAKVAPPKAQNQPTQQAKSQQAWKNYAVKKRVGKASLDDLAALL